jgi:hypothetical protein
VDPQVPKDKGRDHQGPPDKSASPGLWKLLGEGLEFVSPFKSPQKYL